ncbi:hypothetical protein RHMOL_Rhmol09G0191700 [Rhododendron molle]|uniref:Uncharacterized protein n=1 Tax=Rhododendron molle TaxID=49168 RepID=A0ACC0MFB4_RHOML|nr:hypothetical protein RHMOL_Rhmol09G0191700 [Rhododendron molle]
MPWPISNVLQCPSLQVSRKNAFLRSPVPNLPPSVVRTSQLNIRVVCAASSAAGSSSSSGNFNPYEVHGVTPVAGFEGVRFGRTSQLNVRVVCAASSAAGSSSSSGNYDPYEVLGVSPVAGFEGVKQAYASKRKDAQEKGDKATVAQLEEAYDKVMMEQLENRKKGVTSGSFVVSKHIKYADKQPMVPWWPRFTKSSIRDMQINLAISAVFTTWIFIQRNADYKPLEFLFFAFVYRVYEKLRQFEPPTKPKYTEDGEEEGRVLRMGKRLLRSLALVVSCIAVSSFGYTSILNVMESVYKYIPAFVYYNQELFVTASSALMLFFVASYYR